MKSNSPVFESSSESAPTSASMPYLVRRKLGILGFNANEATALATCLSDSGALSRSLGHVEAADDRRVTRVLSLLIVNASGNAPFSPGDSEDRTDQLPVLLIGSARDAEAWSSVLKGRPHTVLLRPYLFDNALLSIHSLLMTADERNLGESVAPPSVLIADDDLKVTSLLRAVFTSLNVECRVAHNGREALCLIRTTLPDLVYLDINMPGMNGWDVLDAVRTDPGTHGTLVAFLSACGKMDDLRKGSLLRANDYVVKPFSTLDLSARTRRLLSFR